MIKLTVTLGNDSRDGDGLGDDEVGECGLCHITKEIVATMQAKGLRKGTDEVVVSGDEVDVCEECVQTILAEMGAKIVPT